LIQKERLTKDCFSYQKIKGKQNTAAARCLYKKVIYIYMDVFVVQPCLLKKATEARSGASVVFARKAIIDISKF
jgi:hypothetical protein